MVRNGRGREVKTIGDGFLLEFRSALEAVQAALAIQESLAQSPPLKARIGIHIADVQRDGDDILGDGVNIASRIEPLAAGGGICVSEDVARQVRNKCPASLVRLGRGELRNVKLPVQVYRVLVHRRDVRVRELLGWAVGRHLRRAWPLASAIAIFLLVLFVRWVATIEPVTEDRLLKRSTLLPSSYIAVLDLEYADEVCRAYAANLTDEIRAYLARKSAFEGLVIVDTEGFSRESKSVREIGAQLRAGSVLYGRVWAENGSWIVDLDRLQKLDELLNRESRIADESPQEAGIKLSMIRDGQHSGRVGLAKNHVAAPLPLENPASFLKGPSGFASTDNRKLGHG